jgi:hypothetical protein
MFRLQNSEGTPGFRVDGYAGDGAPNLTDFGFDNLLGSMSIGPDPFFPVDIDATNFVSVLFANGDGFAGFNVREDPPNTLTFLVMFLEPRFVSLSVDYTAPVASSRARILYAARPRARRHQCAALAATQSLPRAIRRHNSCP